MQLSTSSYVPTLAVRASEMNGLEFLPAATKDRMSPCFLLAPWGGRSKTIDSTIDRLERAFPNRPYFLDIDRDYHFTNPEAPAQVDLIELLNPKDGFKNWIDFVGRHKNVVPCLQTRNLNSLEITSQIIRFQEMDRTFALRIVRERMPENFADIQVALNSIGSADFAIILEGGWVKDAIDLEMWFVDLVRGPLGEIGATVPIVVSCTTVPNEFTDMSGVETVAYSNRQLLDNVRRNTNHTNLIYGDWGSTRPRLPPRFASRPLARVDYPGGNCWHFARSKENNWGFQDAATAIMSSSEIWDGDLDIWGEEMISQTARNPRLGIDTPQKNVASRVNIHLHLQAFYGEDDIHGIDLDEDWVD